MKRVIPAFVIVLLVPLTGCQFFRDSLIFSKPENPYIAGRGKPCGNPQPGDNEETQDNVRCPRDELGNYRPANPMVNN